MSDATLVLYFQDYLSDQITLDQLEDWLTPRLPAIYAEGTSVEKKLVSQFELGLVEMESNRMSEEELKYILTEILYFRKKDEYIWEAEGEGG